MEKVFYKTGIGTIKDVKEIRIVYLSRFLQMLLHQV
jgi:hypothetical protein